VRHGPLKKRRQGICRVFAGMGLTGWFFLHV
jgi:hypothetical protein